MASSQVDICNAALVKLAQDIPIAAMSEQTKAARAFTRCYDRVLDLVLSRHPWPFTLKAQALAASNDAAFPGWAYRYVAPSDCLSAIAVCGSDGVRASLSALACNTDLPLADGRVEFETVGGTQGTNLVADLAGAYLLYAARVTDTSRFSPAFAEALACRLAMEVAPALAGELGLRLRQSLTQDYEMARAEAIAEGFNASRQTQMPTTPSLAAREGY